MNEAFKKDLLRAIKGEYNKATKRVQYLEIDKRGANEVTIGFLEELQRLLKIRIEYLEKKIRFLTSKAPSGVITSEHIETAKQIKISTLIKVPSSKKVLCMFHTDKVPSMHIYETSYHCFSCGAHGTTIDIVMKLYGLTFIESVKKLTC